MKWTDYIVTAKQFHNNMPGRGNQQSRRRRPFMHERIIKANRLVKDLKCISITNYVDRHTSHPIIIPCRALQ